LGFVAVFSFAVDTFQKQNYSMMLFQVLIGVLLCVGVVGAAAQSRHAEKVIDGWSTDGRVANFDWNFIQAQRPPRGQKIERRASIANTFLRSVSMLQSTAGASQYFISTTYKLDNTTIATATATPLNVCLQFPGDPYSVIFGATYADSTSITLSQSIYNDTSCSIFIGSGDHLVAQITAHYTNEQCFHGDGDDDSQTEPVKVINSIVSGTNAFETFGPGEITSTFSSAINCTNQFPVSQFFRNAFSCAESVANSLCTPVNQSITVNSVNSYTISEYTDKTCTKLGSTQLVTLYDNVCVSQAGDNGELFYSTTVLQGFPTSNPTLAPTSVPTSPTSTSSNDDDGVNLSQSTFGGLVAAVFIALAFGIICTTGLFCSGMIPLNGAKKRDLSSQEL
jgi:hypothetical protein